MELNKPFVLFANCIPVKGLNQSTICDLQRKQVKLIPNELYEIITLYNGNTIIAVLEKYESKYEETIKEYFEFLIENEFIFFTDEPKMFPSLSKEFNEPSEVNHAIVDVNAKSSYSINTVIAQLTQLQCRHVEFRFYDTIALKQIETLIHYIDHLQSTILSIDLLVKDSTELNETKLLEVLETYPRIASIKIHSAKKNLLTMSDKNGKRYWLYTTQKITDSLHCGAVSSKYFTINTNTFTESLSYNSCLNGKISIDVNGEIKNCPSMSDSYGNLSNTTLENALHHEAFKKYWSIVKDDIEVCKTCEFRHICTDCRAFLTDPNQINSKPLKCGYDPQTNEWTDWSTNSLNRTTMEIYGFV